MTKPNDHYFGEHAVLYDATIGADFRGDVKFYVEEAVRSGGPVLELGCGTGRITVPIARAGKEITGLDLSESMLNRAKDKIDRENGDVAGRIALLSGDMRDFDPGRKFPLIIIPFRAFLCLMTDDDQRKTLRSVHGHLDDNGRFIFNIFDPNLSTLVEHNGSLGSALNLVHQFIHPLTGNKTLEWRTTEFNLEEQTLEEICLFEELDNCGVSKTKKAWTLRLRYLFRREMEYLLELCGFRTEALYGDFNHSSFRSGGEQIWVAVKC